MTHRHTPKPVLAITIGDPAGIGPEIIAKSLLFPEIYTVCRPLIVGDAQVFAFNPSKSALKIRPILNPAQAQYKPGTMDVLHLSSPLFPKVKLGVPNAASGSISLQAVEQSVALALTRLADGVVHAPISKTAWKMAGIDYPGHTEYLAKLCGVKSVAMAIAAEPLRTVLVSHHIALRKVASALNKTEIIQVILLAVRWMRQLGIDRPRIGVCALNPHAGEGGLLGQEERKIILPAIKQASLKCRLPILGPIPADSAYKQHKEGDHDCLITLYHDQSLIPLKLYNSDALVNITLGLPFARTSPGHGTAFDIAGKNRANPKPMIAAIKTAASLCS